MRFEKVGHGRVVKIKAVDGKDLKVLPNMQATVVIVKLNSA
jgi:hypothetical protein